MKQSFNKLNDHRLLIANGTNDHFKLVFRYQGLIYCHVVDVFVQCSIETMWWLLELLIFKTFADFRLKCSIDRDFFLVKYFAETPNTEQTVWHMHILYIFLKKQLISIVSYLHREQRTQHDLLCINKGLSGQIIKLPKIFTTSHKTPKKRNNACKCTYSLTFFYTITLHACWNTARQCTNLSQKRVLVSSYCSKML